MHTVSTTKLFDLFYKAGLLEHNTTVTTEKLLETMVLVDSLRSKPLSEYMECIHVNEKGSPIAHVSAMPCFGSNVWITQQHCSIVKGHGVRIMMDVMRAIITRPFIHYIIGFYDPKNKEARRIWELAYDIMDDEKICAITQYKLTNYILRPTNKVNSLYLDAFKVQNHEIRKFVELFSRPTGNIHLEGKKYNAVLFKVCEESKEKFKQFFN